MAEVHLIGEMVGATEFPDGGLSCRWSLVTGPAWNCLEGDTSGHTQTDVPMDGNAKWGHPIDVHYSTKGIQGWPKFSLELWHQDAYGRSSLSGYGSCHVPSTPGTHDIECVCWRPVGSASDQAAAYFIGGGVQLRNADLVTSPADRYRLRSTAVGKVQIQVGVILRDFEKYGVVFS
eukprot:m.28141 g.28141  ORF g.28141 m.28141 type:complete len:176 (+) comp8763_c1_seq1:140-667(+)